jgi:hypothetical protein
MSETTVELAKALRRRGLLDASDPLVAAWKGRLLTVAGLEPVRDLSERPAATLGVSRHTAHLLWRSEF